MSQLLRVGYWLHGSLPAVKLWLRKHQKRPHFLKNLTLLVISHDRRSYRQSDLGSKTYSISQNHVGSNPLDTSIQIIG